VVVDREGRLLCGLAGGQIVRVQPESGEVETIGDTGGRPLGLEVAPDGRVLVCDSHRGLLALDPVTGSIDSLVRQVDGVPLRFCSNAAAQSDGTIWFTEASSRFGFEDYLGDFLEHRGSGRLFRRDPDGRVEVVLTGLQFANGLALTADETALILAETGAYSLSRVAILGPAAGRREVIASNLPGMPDNVSRSPAGHFWVAMVTPRNPFLDRLSGRPGLRRLVWRIPQALQPKPVHTVWAMAFDGEGRAIRDFEGQRDDFFFATGVLEHAGKLYLASTEVAGLMVLDLTAG
jgi:sugar lactone lactonase YvrE